MHLYRQSIILFGIVAPILGAAAIVTVGFMVRSHMTESFDNKQKNFKIYEQSRMSGLEIEAQVTRQRQHMERWSKLLSEETASAVASHMRQICEHLPSKEIQQTAFERPGANGGFGTVSAQNSSQIRMAFRGTFRSIQKAFLELETRMPQLQLQELKMEPSSTQASVINFQVTYTAWEN
jgi:hypothetical protein